MKVNNSILSAVAIAAFISIAAPAQAQKSRFRFAGQTYPLEQSVAPKLSPYNGPTATVTRGSVPKSNNWLTGLLPDIHKPAPQIAAQPQSVANVFPSMISPPANFKSEFGKPMQQSAAAAPKALPVAPAAKTNSNIQICSSEHVQGRLKPVSKSRVATQPAAAAPAAAAPTKPVAGYGNSFYVPGNTDPVASGASSGASFSYTSKVGGRVLPRQKD